jgi:hypothetical protein
MKMCVANTMEIELHLRIEEGVCWAVRLDFKWRHFLNKFLVKFKKYLNNFQKISKF